MERDLALMTLEDLTQMARQRGLRGYSTMTKNELLDALSASASETPASETPERDTGKQDAPDRSPAPAAAQTLDAPAPLTTQLEGVVEAEAKPTEPQFKKTWIRDELLIDDVLPELPGTYGDEKLVLMVRDPFWVHAYWDLTAKTLARVHALGGERMALRVYDVTDLVFDGRNAHSWFEIPAPEYARNWNIQMPQDGRNYLVELGWLTAGGRFLPVMRSNVVDVPIGRPSPVIADKFVELPFDAPAEAVLAPSAPAEEADVAEVPVEAESPEAVFVSSEDLAPPVTPSADQNLPLPETMFRLSTRGRGAWSADSLRPNETTWEAMESVAGSAMGSHRMGSQAVSSFAQPPAPPAEARENDKDFWLVANCELIVYGATEADARVTLRGQKIELRPDGTFSIRFAFPDGLHPIPIHAVNADGDMERSITITVSRDTQP